MVKKELHPKDLNRITRIKRVEQDLTD